MLVVLAAVVLLAGAWFTVLRPKSDDGGSTPAPVAQAPGTSGLAKAVDKAKGAVAQSNASASRAEQTAKAASGDDTAATPSSSAAKSPTATSVATTKATERVAAGDPSGKLLAKLISGKTVVLLFWNPKGADDKAVRAALHDISGNKNVATAVASIDDVGDYEAITTGVKVLTAPTVLVIGKNYKAKTITGLTDAVELRQTIGDVRAGR